MPQRDQLTRFAAVLEHYQGFPDWQAEQRSQRSTQLFLLGERAALPPVQVETRRVVATSSVQLQVFNDHPPRNAQPETPLARGSTKRVLLEEEINDPTQLAYSLEEMAFIAGLIDNPSYILPAPPANGYPTVATSDPALARSDKARAQAVNEVRERLLAAIAHEPGITLSSAELFATSNDIAFRNSRGIQASRSETSLFCDLVLLAHAGTQVAEYHTAPERRRLDDLPIEDIVRRAASYARDTLRTQPTPTHAGPVVISGEALVDLFSPLIFHTSAQAAYQGISRFTPGASIYGEQVVTGDRLTLFSSALLPYGLASAPFDADGIPGQRVLLIEDGMFKAPWAEQRYADYLHIPPTGSFANLEIAPGNHTLHDLLHSDGPVYHLVAFAWLNPDDLTGDFVAEIKLGYRIEHGQIIPIKGGSLSGNLFEALAEARFSRETQFTGSYLGPKALRLESLTISGA
ncbi:MAG TPA: TldD/PmbA family protein [Ktedonobacterales bacterium]|jgi:PmbA protein